MGTLDEARSAISFVLVLAAIVTGVVGGQPGRPDWWTYLLWVAAVVVGTFRSFALRSVSVVGLFFSTAVMVGYVLSFTVVEFYMDGISQPELATVFSISFAILCVSLFGYLYEPERGERY